MAAQTKISMLVIQVREARENIKDLLKIANTISRGIGSGSTLGNIFHQMGDNGTDAELTNEEVNKNNHIHQL